MAKLICTTVAAVDGRSGVLTVSLPVPVAASAAYHDEMAERAIEVLELLPVETLNRIQVWLAGRFVPANAKRVEDDVQSRENADV